MDFSNSNFWSHKTTSNVLELYEKGIAEALAAKEKLSQTYEKEQEELKTDRDVNFQHLLSLESTFADLHMWVEIRDPWQRAMDFKISFIFFRFAGNLSVMYNIQPNCKKN